jgi:acyl-CoA hydrolase
LGELKAKHVSESITEQTQLVFYSHLNSQKRLFGGTLVSWIDVLAGVVARRHSSRHVTTAAIDNLQFKRPVYASNTVVLRGKITYVGHTSMEVRVDSYVEELSGELKLVNIAYLVLVALDSEGKPTPVPALICDTPEEKAEWEAGKRRHALRIQRRMEAF